MYEKHSRLSNVSASFNMEVLLGIFVIVNLRYTETAGRFVK